MSSSKSVKAISKRVLFVIVTVLVLTVFSMSAIGCSVDQSEIDTEVELAETLNEVLGEYTGLEAVESFVEEIKNNEELLAAVNLAATSNYFFAFEKETNQILLVKVNEDFSSYEVLFGEKEGYGELDDSWYFAVYSDEVGEKIEALGASSINVLKSVEDILGSENPEQPEDKNVELTNDNPYVVNSEDADVVLDFEDADVVAGDVLEQLPFQALKGKLTINGGVIKAEGKIPGYSKNGVIGVGHENPNLVLNNVTVEGPQDGVAVFAPSTLNINGNPQIEMNGANLTANTGLLLQIQGEATLTDTTITADTLFSMSHGATVVVKSGKYVATGLIVWLNNHADREALGYPMTSLQIEGGEFIFPENTRVFNFRTNGRGNIEAIITGGTFNGKAFNELTVAEWKALCTGDVKVEGALTDYIRITFPKKVTPAPGIGTAADLLAQSSYEGTKSVTVGKDIELTGDQSVLVNNSEANITVNLGNNKVTGKELTGLPFQVAQGTLTINGGTIEADGKIEGFNGTAVVGVGNENANLVLNNTTVNGEGGVAVFAPSTLDIIGNPQIEMNGANLTANTGLLLQVQGEAELTETVIEADTLFSLSHGATVVVKSGKYIARELIVWLNNHANATELGFPMTSLQIEGGEFIFPENARVFNFRTNGRGGIEAIITGGTFNGKAFNEITENEWKALCTGDVKVEGALTDYIRITFPKKEVVNPGIQSSNDLIGKVNNQGTQTLKVGKDLELTGEQSVLVNNSEANITVDLGNNKVTGNELTGLPFQVAQGTLTINGGTIEAEAVLEGYGSKVNIGVGNDDPKLVLNNTKVNGTADSVAVFAPSTLDIIGNPEIELNGAELTAGVGILLQSQGEATLTDTTVYADTLFSMSHGAKVVVKSGKYVVTSLIVWLNNHANATELGFPMTSLQIEGGEFVFPENTRVFNFRTNGRGGIEAIITGGTFNGKAFNELTVAEWKALCTGDVKVEGALTDYIRITFPKK